MKALFLTSNYPRWVGDSTTPFVHDLAVDLVQRGWAITVLAPHAHGAARREQLDGVEVRRFQYVIPQRAQTVCYNGGALLNIAGSRLTKAKVPALVAAEWAATARAVAGGFDVVHAHWTLPQGFVSAISPNQRAPRILTVHGGDVFGLRGRLTDRASAFALRRADCVTVASSATESAVREIAGPTARVQRVPLGVDLTRAPHPELVDQIRSTHRRPSGPLLVFVGRVVEEKGVYELVTAIARLAADYPDVTAAVVGSGPNSEQVRQLAGELGVGDRIWLPGWADPDEVPSWFAAADVVVAPSKVGPNGWTEGQGLAILEAMAVAKPVIATRTGGIPDTITDGQNGLLVEPGDADGLAGAVRTLIGTPDLARRLAANAASSVRERFDRSASADRFDSIYRVAIAANAHERDGASRNATGRDNGHG